MQAGCAVSALRVGAEPTLYPDLEPLCRKMAEAGVVLENLTTNGIKLDDKRIGYLLPLGPTNFNVSLNYTTPEKYEQFMQIPGDRFEVILENISRLDRTLLSAGKRQDSQIHVQFFVHRSTVDDLDKAMELAIELPVNAITLRSVGDCRDDEQLRPEDIKRLETILPRIAERSRTPSCRSRPAPAAPGKAWPGRCCSGCSPADHRAKGS